MLKDVLKKLREEAGITQSQIAEVLSVSRSTYTYYETGKTKPSLECLKMIARIYNVTTDYLLENTDAVISGRTVGVSQSNKGYKISGSEAFNLAELDNAEQQMILSYRLLPKEIQKEILQEIDKKRIDYLNKKV